MGVRVREINEEVRFHGNDLYIIDDIYPLRDMQVLERELNKPEYSKMLSELLGDDSPLLPAASGVFPAVYNPEDTENSNENTPAEPDNQPQAPTPAPAPEQTPPPADITEQNTTTPEPATNIILWTTLGITGAAAITTAVLIFIKKKKS